MTRSDYKKFAAIIKEQRDVCNQNIQYGGDETLYESRLEQIDVFIEEFCTLFEEDNPSFDEDLFREACGV